MKNCVGLLFAVVCVISNGVVSGQRIEPKDLEFRMGVPRIDDRETFDKLSYKGFDTGRDPYLSNLQYVKFIIERIGEKDSRFYFMNTKNYRAHPPYMRMVGAGGRDIVRGALTYLPLLKTPDGGAGLYVYDFQPNNSYSFEQVKAIRDALVAKMPLLKGKVAFHPLRGNMDRYQAEKAKYAGSDVAVHLDDQIYANIAFLPLNSAESFGLLRELDNNRRPTPRDIMLCKTLPNQMPRVAGVISAVRQTPLSHVNLRAVQDKVPNAYVNRAATNKNIRSLLGKLVYYKVTPRGYTLRAATKAEVDKHFASLRPSKPQVPERELSLKKITALKNIQFKQASSFGVKTANLATLHSFDLPVGTVPDGFGVPFFFFDEFMKHNRFYEAVEELLNSSEFQQANRDAQRMQLKKLRERIEKGEMPAWMLTALAKVQQSFPKDSSIRCRSSTNNEDLPGFSGAGLYDSFTHRPDEGHLANTIKQVYASLWNYRAYEERDFYRIDHQRTAMGVLLHPNSSQEKANGVAVTDDILYDTVGNYYLNTQLGEDLVTNPSQESSPEEVLLGWWSEDGHEIVRRSTQVSADKQLLSEAHLTAMRKHLARIHGKFRKLYGHGENDKFAMEIEYKVTKANKLLIKQARPWVYAQ